MFDINTMIWTLIIVLILGTIYAWYQFALVLARKCDTCSLDLKESPFKSKCFVGAIFFSIALVLSINAGLLLNLF